MISHIFRIVVDVIVAIFFSLSLSFLSQSCSFCAVLACRLFNFSFVGLRWPLFFDCLIGMCSVFRLLVFIRLAFKLIFFFPVPVSILRATLSYDYQFFLQLVFTCLLCFFCVHSASRLVPKDKVKIKYSSS